MYCITIIGSSNHNKALGFARRPKVICLPPASVGGFFVLRQQRRQQINAPVISTKRHFVFLMILVLISLFSLLLNPFSFLSLPVLINNWEINKSFNSIRKAVSNHKGTSKDYNLLSIEKRIGNLGGSSNHLDVEILVLIASNLTPSKFYETMREKTIILPFSGQNNLAVSYNTFLLSKDSIYHITDKRKVKLSINPSLTTHFDAAWVNDRDISLDRDTLNMFQRFMEQYASAATKSKNLYIIIVYDQISPSTSLFLCWDPRCH